MGTLLDLGSGEKIGIVDDHLLAQGIPEWVRPPREGGWTEPVAPPDGTRQIRPDGIALVAPGLRRGLLDDVIDDVPRDNLDEMLRERIYERRRAGAADPDY
ncbi:MAG: hypothetical protein E6J45_10625 [Chloroflexi bacterium]|nr:MAG: hypothetical protein E6J45_10625 [Chloroflexota bacterium]